MSEEKNNNVESEVVEEVVEETPETTEEENVNTEEAAEDTEVVVEEEAAEDAEVVEAEEVAVAEEEAVEEAPTEEATKKISSGAIIAIAAVVVAVVAVVVLVAVKGGFSKLGFGESYSTDYIDISGITIGEIANDSGLEFDEFLAFYDLPKNMPASVSENVAINNIPAGTYVVKMFDSTFEDIKEELGWGDEITEETPIGEALAKTTLSNYVGDEQLDAFKEAYGLDESVTGDTLWGEVRDIVDSKRKEELEEEKAAESGEEINVEDEAVSEEAAPENAEAEAEAAPEAAEAEAEAAPEEAEAEAETKAIE